MGLDPKTEVAYATFTGKASQVLREKGCPNATTAHKLLYKARPKPNGKFMFVPKEYLGPYKVIVIDEISMLPKDMWELLLKHKGIYIIASGDPFQIPPISKDQDNEVLNHPHIFLDEIMRQAQDSDIIKISMNIRAGIRLTPLMGNDVQVFSKRNIVNGMYTWADQIIVATNNKRKEVNDLMRLMQGRGNKPEIGDKIICLRNCWNVYSQNLEPLINGSIGYISNMHLEDIEYIGKGGQRFYVPTMITDIDVGNEHYENILIDYTSLTTGEKFLTPQQEYGIKSRDKEVELPIEFNYGYAITAHKAQGSQWNKILMIEERFPFDEIKHARWMYTTLTRAVDKATVILK